MKISSVHCVWLFELYQRKPSVGIIVVSDPITDLLHNIIFSFQLTVNSFNDNYSWKTFLLKTWADKWNTLLPLSISSHLWPVRLTVALATKTTQILLEPTLDVHKIPSTASLVSWTRIIDKSTLGYFDLVAPRCKIHHFRSHGYGNSDTVKGTKKALQSR